MNIHIYVNCLMILGGIFLIVYPKAPKVYPTDTQAARGFAYIMRTFSLAAILNGLLGIISFVGAHNAYFSKTTLNILFVIRTQVGGIALGLIFATFVSGQFSDWCRTMRAKRKELKKVKG